MSDEQKTNNQVKPTPLGKVEILVMSDGSTPVTGPVDNPVAMMDIFGRAMRVVANHVAMKAGESQNTVSQPNIIVPK